MNYICQKCGKVETTQTYKANCDCSGLWQLDFIPQKFDLKLIDNKEWNIFRYKAFMPIKDYITLGEGMTPIIKFDNHLKLKMDYFMPTLSFKDRGAAMLISHCKEIGVQKVVQDSSGNAGNSIAAYAAKAGIECEIYVPSVTSPKKIDMIKAHGAKCHIIEGKRDNCADVCRQRVINDGVYYANHVYNPYFYEGTKTYIYEVYEQLGRIPENIWVPVGNGTLVFGVIKGLEHLYNSKIIDKIPEIYLVQSEFCAPIYDEFNHKTSEIKETLAEGIAIGKPMRKNEILNIAKKYNIKIVKSPENKILYARDKLAKQGIYCEHTTAATYAAYLSYIEKYGQLADNLISMCGAGLKSDH